MPQGDPEIIDFLNEVLTAELTAINQYFIHAKMSDNWGYDRLAKKFYEESIDEMKDAEKIIERILYLDGVPNLQRYGTVAVGETVPEQLELDLADRGRRDRALQPRRRPGCRARPTTAPATCSRSVSPTRRATSTGSRPSSSAIADIGIQNYLSQQLYS